MDLVKMENKRAQSRDNRYAHWHREPMLQFRHNNSRQAMDSVNSGESSPCLRKNNSASRPKSPSYPLLGHHHHRTSSPDSRAQAIARGQWELMEMVKNMPESAYELSLKDLVENYQEITRDDGSTENNQDMHQRMVVKMKRSEEKNKKIMNDNKNVSGIKSNGLFLNMVFPLSLKSRKKKGGDGERDWWKKRFTRSSDSDSSRTSNNSGGGTTTATTLSSGGSGRKRNGSLTGCWPFTCSGRGQSKSV